MHLGILFRGDVPHRAHELLFAAQTYGKRALGVDPALTAITRIDRAIFDADRACAPWSERLGDKGSDPLAILGMNPREKRGFIVERFVRFVAEQLPGARVPFERTQRRGRFPGAEFACVEGETGPLLARSELRERFLLLAE